MNFNNEVIIIDAFLNCTSASNLFFGNLYIGADDRLGLLEALKEKIENSRITSTTTSTTTSSTSTTSTATTTRPIPVGPSAEKGLQLPEHDEYDGDEPLVIKKPEKDAITFHPEIVKQTLAKLDNLSQDELELINKFVDAYKNKVF